MNLPINKFNRIIIFNLVLVLIFSCENRPNGVLNKNKMTDILFEMQKLDGSLEAKGINYNQTAKKEKYYKSLLDEYGITQADFDSSLVWYSKNPKKLEKIYDVVYERLSNLQSDVQKGKYHPVDSAELLTVKINLWNKPIKYNFTKDSTRSKLDFEIINNSLQYRDRYTLKFLQRISPEDSCKNQQIIIKLTYFNGIIDTILAKAYNDSLLRRYSFRFPASRKLKIKSISGELLASDAYKGNFHAMLDSISFWREYRSDWQDSLRSLVQKTDPTIYENKSVSIKKPTDVSPKVLKKLN